MPVSAVIAAISTFTAVATGGALMSVGFLTSMGIGAIAQNFLISTAMGAALNALAPKPPTASATRGYSIAGESGAALDHQIIYGTAKVGGVRVYDSTTGGANNKYLHRILVFAGHEIDSYAEIYVNNDLVTLDGSGFVTAPAQYVSGVNKYIRIKKYFGTAVQTADADLITDTGPELTPTTGEWSSLHKLSGLAYLYVRFEYNADVFPNGVPTISAVIKGKKVYDPRTTTTVWSDNPALCLRDYLTQGYGLDIPAARISDDHVIAAANICDQSVTSNLYTPLTTTGASGNGSVATLTFASQATAPFVVGSRVSVTGITPTGYNGTYVVTACTNTTVSFASTTTGSQTVAGTVGNDLRYTCNGAFVTAFTPNQVISDIITSMGGLFWYSQGKWRMKASAYTAPTVTLTENDLRSSVSVSTRHSRRDTFNTVKGKFKGAESDWQEADYPQVISQAAIDADNGLVNTADYSLPFTTSSITAQRIAKIFLFRNREQLTVSASFGLKAFQVEVGDIVNLSLARFGWLPKTFEVTNWSFGLTEGLDLQVNLTLREISSQVFDDVDGSIFESNNTSLPSPFTVASVGITLSQETVISFESLTNTLYAAITAADPTSVERVEVQYKLSSDTIWNGMGVGDLGVYQVTGVADGLYDVRARSYSYLGVKGGFTTESNYQISTVSAPPNNVTNFSYNLSGGTVGLQWTPVSNLDLSYYKIRHTVLESGATWSDAVTAIDKVSRPATSINAPVKSGTYMLRAYNKSAKTSASFASVVIPSTNLETFTNNPTPITDSPTFTGTKVNCSGASLATTGASGTGSVATITFAAQASAPFSVGYSVTISGVTPAGYNGTYIVTACTTTSVSFANTTTGSQTVAGTAVGALRINNRTFTTTGASGTGSVATLTFATQASAPYSIGSTITVSGITPIGYNGTYTVTGCTTTSVSFASTATGSQTVAGTIFLASATYDFSAYIDTTTVRRVRTRVDLQVARYSIAGGLFDDLVGLFDSQSGLFDDLTGFSAYEDTDVVTYISTTPDNPAGTPTWSAYQPFVSGDFYGRAFRFRVELKSYSANVTPSITSLIARVQYN